MLGTEPRARPRGRLGALGIVLMLTACADARPVPEAPAEKAPEGRAPAGTVELLAVEVARPGQPGGGSGTLAYRGATHPFAITGLGVDGSFVAPLDTAGEVYNLQRLADFPGAYVAGQYGVVVGDAGAGDIWLENERKVIIHLLPRQDGLQLALGGDALVIRLSE